MSPSQSLRDVCIMAARDFQAASNRDASQLEIAELVASIRGRLIIWAAVPLGATCIAVWQALHPANV